MSSQEIYHAYFSQKQKELRNFIHNQSNAINGILGICKNNIYKPHTNIYLTTDGNEVEVTQICKDPNEYNKKEFTDFVYLGQVTKWLRVKY